MLNTIYPDFLLKALEENNVDLLSLLYVEPTEGDNLNLDMDNGNWSARGNMAFFYDLFLIDNEYVRDMFGGGYISNGAGCAIMKLPGVVMFWWRVYEDKFSYRMAVYYSPEQTLDEHMVYLRLLMT